MQIFNGSGPKIDPCGAPLPTHVVKNFEQEIPVFMYYY